MQSRGKDQPESERAVPFRVAFGMTWEGRPAVAACLSLATSRRAISA